MVEAVVVVENGLKRPLEVLVAGLENGKAEDVAGLDPNRDPPPIAGLEPKSELG